jgi:hypothetical protein
MNANWIELNEIVRVDKHLLAANTRISAISASSCKKIRDHPPNPRSSVVHSSFR